LFFLPNAGASTLFGAQILPVNQYPKILPQNKFSLDTGDVKCPACVKAPRRPTNST